MCYNLWYKDIQGYTGLTDLPCKLECWVEIGGKVNEPFQLDTMLCQDSHQCIDQGNQLWEQFTVQDLLHHSLDNAHQKMKNYWGRQFNQK